MDLQLARSIRWIDEEADLMAIVLRSQIELRSWAEFVSTGPAEAAKFLNEVNIDIQEVHQKMDKAFPGIDSLPMQVTGKRIELKRADDSEEFKFKLCSKLIHPTALTLNHPEMTINSADYKEYLAVEVLFHAWLIVDRFHNIIWTD